MAKSKPSSISMFQFPAKSKSLLFHAVPPKPKIHNLWRRAAALVLSALCKKQRKPFCWPSSVFLALLIALPPVPIPAGDRRAIVDQRTEKSTFVYVCTAIARPSIVKARKMPSGLGEPQVDRRNMILVMPCPDPVNLDPLNTTFCQRLPVPQISV